MAYTTIDDPSAFFQAIIYEGGTANAKTFSGNSDLAPNWWWGKKREVAQNHYFVDSVRGITNSLQGNVTGAEYTDTEADDIASFDSNGFTFNDTGDQFNGTSSDASYVAWCWKAGTSFSNDASSTSVGSIDSAGSVSTTAGFSIIAWNGNDGTVAHGLGVKPAMIIIKSRQTVNNWVVFHKGLGTMSAASNSILILNGNNEVDDPGAGFSEPTTSVFTIKGGAASNDNNIGYVFAEKQGYSKFGSFVSNNTTDNIFVYCGFKPALVLAKSTTSTNDWVIFDNKRDPFNVTQHKLYPNINNAEATTENDIDFLSNGFKLRNGYGANTFVFMAIAEQPFVTSTGVPATAR